MPTVRLSPRAFRRIALGALLAVSAIIITGGAVRLTGSGLGCPDWPNCDAGHLAPHGDLGGHATIEWTNRLFTGVVSLAVMLAVLGSLVRRPRRRDLTWLSVGLVAGVAGQVVLGGLTVLFGLAPPLVMAHFLVSLVLVADAVVLHDRASRPDLPAGDRWQVTPRLKTVGRVVLVAAGAVFVTGTIVTGAGPHGGDEDVSRLAIAVTTAARIHGVAVNVLIAATLVALWLASRGDAARSVAARARVLLAVEVAQAVIGYVQYFTGVPELLVALHLAGAVAVWIAALHFVLGFHADSAGARATPADRSRVVSSAPA